MNLASRTPGRSTRVSFIEPIINEDLAMNIVIADLVSVSQPTRAERVRSKASEILHGSLTGSVEVGSWFTSVTSRKDACRAGPRV